uniref:Mitochondrial thiamine pyrophosphate carrier n=1 Tax=Arion vulgaris TaxID=1028688 RepID=A0A0B7B1I1_9EUPU
MMVGYNPKEDVHLSHIEHAAAGAFSGAVTRTLFQPLDVLKIRFQLQVEPLKPSSLSKYHGMIQAVGCIVRDEGIKALWKGHIPAQVLSVVYGVGQYGCFEILTEEVWRHFPEALTTIYRPLTHSICGGLSGCVATTIIHPVDVIRTRFVAQGEPKIYNSMLSAVQTILKEEGVRGFYRGLLPAVAQVGPQMGFQFGFYTAFTGLWNSSLGLWPETPPESMQSLVCGIGSGSISKLIVYPLDVVKKRLQVQGFEKARQPFGAVRGYNGLYHCLRVSVREEGFNCLYKGLRPSILKSALVAGANFSIYEQACAALSYHHNS